MKQIVGYFVFQTEVLNGLTLRHCLRFVVDEQIVDYAIILTLSITNKFALHSLNWIIQNHCCYTCLLNFGLQQRRSTFLYFRTRRHFWTLTEKFYRTTIILFICKLFMLIFRIPFQYFSQKQKRLSKLCKYLPLQKTKHDLLWIRYLILIHLKK